MIDVLTLHIGQPKTGTSSVQATFRESAGVLARHGLFYYARTRNNHPVARPFHRGSGDDEDRREQARFLAAAAATPLPRALLSSETLIRLLPREVDACITTLRKVARRVDVLMYVRHPVAFAASSVSQGVRSGIPLATSLATARVVPLRKLVTRWRAVVGRENFRVRPFARTLLVNGDVVDDVLDALGCGAAAPELTRVEVNEGLSVLGIHLMDQAMATVPGRRLPLDSLRAYEAIGGPPVGLPLATLAEVRRLSEPEMAFLAKDFGIVLPEPPERPMLSPGLSEEELASLAGVMHRVTQYAYEMDRSPMGRLLDVRAPFTEGFDVEPSRLHGPLKRLGLLRLLAPRPPARRKVAAVDDSADDADE